MYFLDSAPAGAREIITHYLDGKPSHGEHGYRHFLARAKKDLAAIETAMAQAIEREDEEGVTRLRTKRVEMRAEAEQYAGDVAILERFAFDDRMREAYESIGAQLSDQQWHQLLFAAWVSRADYGHYRDRLTAASEVTKAIAAVAKQLADLLDDFQRLGLEGPATLHSLPALLRCTSPNPLRDGVASDEAYMWRSFRRHILGDANPTEVAVSSSDAVPAVKTVFVELGEHVSSSAHELTQDLMRYVWRFAPELSDLLRTVSSTAKTYVPRETSMVGAAIKSRQRSRKLEYLRAFVDRLKDVQLVIPDGAMHGLAITATVALNDADLIVTKQDISYADSVAD